MWPKLSEIAAPTMPTHQIRKLPGNHSNVSPTNPVTPTKDSEPPSKLQLLRT